MQTSSTLLLNYKYTGHAFHISSMPLNIYSNSFYRVTINSNQSVVRFYYFWFISLFGSEMLYFESKIYIHTFLNYVCFMTKTIYNICTHK